MPEVGNAVADVIRRLLDPPCYIGQVLIRQQPIPPIIEEGGVPSQCLIGQPLICLDICGMEES